MTNADDFDPMAVQTTLYDVAGLDRSASSSDILDTIARLTSEGPDAYRVRRALALEALADDSFRETYDQHVDAGGSWRENNHLPILPEMPAAGWGTEEMAQWIESTKEILVPTRRNPSSLEALPVRARNRFARDLPVPIWSVYVTLATLASASVGDSGLSALLGVKTFGVPAVAAVGGFVGTVLGSIYQGARTWQMRAAILSSTAVATPLLSVTPLGAAALSAVSFATVYAVSARARAAEKTWASEPVLPPVPQSPWAPVDGRSATRLGAGTSSPAQAAGVLRAWAGRIGFPVREATPDDLVAAVITADAWAFALGADSVSQAANFGPVSLGAISAAVARASGYGEGTLPMLPGEWASPLRMPGLREACLDWKSWATQQLGQERGIRAVETAAADLTWGGGGDDRLTRLARYMTGTAR